MALGATWNPQNAQTVGQIVGQELSAIGVNMLLSPLLDILQNPQPGSSNDINVRTFGGNPYWVSQMGQAYTSGVHQGSNGRIAVIAKYFPGSGSSDRPVTEEIPTVQRMLADLINSELIPFFAITNPNNPTHQTADGLMTAHIRYLGFQGNIQSTTTPVSLDAQALATLFNLPQLTQWRQNGGLVVSDKLGVRAIERFYDSAEEEFPHRVVAKDAFLAGNDLLYLGDFALGGATYDTQLANMKDTILWFQERYRTDVTFQQQVDKAVQRILQLKLRQYNQQFSLESVQIDNDADNLATAVGQNNNQLFDIAQAAITLLYPHPDTLTERIPRPPGLNDNLLIFTDVRTTQQCSFCPPQPLIGQEALAERILALYGPQASGQVQPEQIASYTFANLNEFLAAGPGPIIYDTTPITPTLVPESTTPSSDPDAEETPNPDETSTPDIRPTPTPLPTATPPPAYLVQQSLQEADWIIFALLDQSTADSQALSNFLAQRPDLIRNKQLIVFAFNAPYYLDTTEISQLSAYYGVYSKVEPFLDAAVRALFLEQPLTGKSPVNVLATGYNLEQQTAPKPDQIIALSYSTQESELESVAGADPLAVAVGDTMRLQTGVILDHNDNPVPDGTLVRFMERDRVQGSLTILAEVVTSNGLAQLDYVLQARTEGGQYRIGVEAGPATVSQELDISVSDRNTGEAQIVVINPTLAPTQTAVPTVTALPTSAPPTSTTPPTATATPTPAPPQEPGLRIELSQISLLLTMTVGLFLVGSGGLMLARRTSRSRTYWLGSALWGMIGGLIIYIYYALALPGTAVLYQWGSWAGLLTILLGGIGGLLLYHLRHKTNP
jgi:beta-N-acetylhexosaminidase